jgi:UDP-3-O-[3-hydroxymyristoyl] glucosamine N-acyltransferase
VGGVAIGDKAAVVTGLNGIEHALPGDLTFLGSPRYLSFLETTQATAVLVPQGVARDGLTMVVVENPYAAFAQMLAEYEKVSRSHPQGIHPTAVVGAHTTLGKNVALGPHVVIDEFCTLGDDVVVYANSYIGAHTSIGPGTLIYPNVTIRERTTIGARCIFQPGAVIGADGFGYTPVGGRHHKIPQVGVVVIGDDVEIGANSADDRATCGETIIGNGTKIDNLVQIGHNVRIGEHTTFSGASAVAGSAAIGSHVTVAGQVGVSDHVTIGDRVMIGAKSGVTKTIAPGSIVSGYPARDHQKEKRIQATIRHLPELQRRIHELEARLKELVSRADG